MILGALSLMTALGTYTVVSNLPGTNPVLIPPPQDIVAAAITTIENGNLASAILSSLQRQIIGFVIGTTCAIIIGSIMGWFRTFEYILDPLVETVRPIPPLAWIPLVIIWFGIGETSRILVITVASFLVCIVNVFSGMKQVPNVHVEAAQTLGARPIQIFYTVAIPSALPYIFAGLRIALAASWTVLVAAELLAAQSGLGYLMQTARRFYNTDVIIVTIICIGLLAFITDRLFRIAQAYLSRWSEVR